MARQIGVSRSERRERTRAARRTALRRTYEACSELTGPPWTPPTDQHPVRFRRLLSVDDRAVLTALVLFSSVTAVAFIGWLVLPSHVPGGSVVGLGGWRVTAARLTFCLMVAVELIRLGQNACVLLFSFNASDPVPMKPLTDLRVALLTTIVPSREPIETVGRALAAMREVSYPGQVDVWILDEGDDPEVKAMAARLGVRHFTRKGRPEHNQPSGTFKAKTKAGNHNAWRAEHEDAYDVVGIFDPDHVVLPCFLERTSGYFRDPDVAFVVSPQVYGNMYDCFLTHGASGQQWLFNAVIERAGNGLDAPMLTGTNNLYRPAALAQIGGFQSSVVEDHLTSIHIHANRNPRTGNQWRSVYTPDILAIGEGPTTWTDYFSQQTRWAYGNNEIVTRRRLWPDARMPLRQRLFYGMLQFYYPSVAASWLMGNVAVATYLAVGVRVSNLDPVAWLGLWGASVTSCFTLLLWLRRFNLVAHERREWGVPAYLLSLFTTPIYVAAAIAAVLRRPLSFTVTAKGKLRSVDSPRTFRPQLLWACAIIAAMSVGLVQHHDSMANGIWALLTVAAGVMPLVISALDSHPAVSESARGRKLATVEAKTPGDAEVASQARAKVPGQARGRAQVPVHANRRVHASAAGHAAGPMVSVVGVYQQRDGKSGRMPDVVEDVPLADRPFVGTAKVVERVGMSSDPD